MSRETPQLRPASRIHEHRLRASPRAAAALTLLLIVCLVAGSQVGQFPFSLDWIARSGPDAGVAIKDRPAADPEKAPSLAQAASPLPDDMIVVGSPYGLHALDRDSGIQRWHFPAGNTKNSSPATDGATVYTGNDAGVLYAVDANSGRERWRRVFGEKRQVWSPAVADGIVFVAAEVRPNGSLAASSPEGKVWAFDAATGEERWTFATKEEVTTTPAFADGMLFVSVRDDHIYAIDAASGRQLWAYPIQGKASDPVSADGRLYVQVGTVMQVLDISTGHQLWAEGTSRVPAEATPAIANGVLFLVSHGAHGFYPYTEHLLALGAAAGEHRWSAELEGELNALPLVQGSVVYIAGDICTSWRMDGMSMKCDGERVIRFYALDAESGDVLWSLDLPGELVTDPVISGNLAIIQGTSSMLSAIDIDTRAEQWSVLLVDLVTGAERWTRDERRAEAFGRIVTFL